MRNSSMGDVEAVPASSLMSVAPLTWSKEVPDFCQTSEDGIKTLGTRTPKF